MSWDKILKYGARDWFVRPTKTGDHDEHVRRIREALDTIAPLFEPMAVELELGYLSNELSYFAPDDRPKRNSFHIREQNLPKHVGLAPMFEGPVLELPRVDGEAIQKWMREVLTEPCTYRDPDFRTSWEQMSFRACRGRLHAGSEDAFLIENVNDRIPVEKRSDGSRWIAGPLDLPGARLAVPCKVQFCHQNEKSQLELNLSVFWSIWDDEGSPSARVFDELKEKIVALGWDKRPIL